MERFSPSIAAPLRSDREDGLFPTVVVDLHGRSLGLVYSSKESLREAVRTRQGVYHSRKRGLWHKGESSGDVQRLREIRLDCDRDALEFVVIQEGKGFCHQGTLSCFGEVPGLPSLARLLEARLREAPEASYTKRLFTEEGLLGKKIIEEAHELVATTGPLDTAAEAADLLYFMLVRMVQMGVPLAEVEAELRRRSLKVHRRPGDAKPGA